MEKRSYLVVCLPFVAILTLSPTEVRAGTVGTPEAAWATKLHTADLWPAWNQIEGGLLRTAEAKGVKIPEDARDVIKKEVILRELSKGVPPSQIKISEPDSEQLVEQIAVLSKGKNVTAASVVALLAEDKVEKVTTTLPTEISKSAKESGIELAKRAREVLEADLTMQTKWSAYSGIPLVGIRNRNQEYLMAVWTSSPSRFVDAATYRSVKAQLFSPLVMLTIHSIPAKAKVEVAGTVIGETTIQEKRFEPGREYRFLFKIVGYSTAERKYFVTPYPSAQEFTEILVPQGKGP